MSWKNYSLPLVLYVRLIMVIQLLLVLSFLWWPCCSSMNPKFVWNKRRSNSEVSMWFNSKTDAHSVITYFQKIHQQLNFGVQGRSICIPISFKVMWTPTEFLDYLMISWYLPSHLFHLQQNIYNTCSLQWVKSAELHHTGDQPLTLCNWHFSIP